MRSSEAGDVRSRHLVGINGLTMHVLEAGDPADPALLLLHGFPELAYSWRKVMAPLAAAGYHVVAPDQRGYGGTVGWSGNYDTDLAPFRLLNLARDALALLSALSHRSVSAVIGHDFGASVAAVCALARPDVFRAVALMSAPFTGPPTLPFGTGALPAPPDPIHHALAQLPHPRKHYQRYFATRAAAQEMAAPRQGLHAFLRAYYHGKSGDWPGNKPVPLAGWTADALATMPGYYIMNAADSMPEAVAPFMPTPAQIAACHWLTEDELAVYAAAFGRTGFGGGLNWYRCRTDGVNADLDLFSGRTIDVPSVFIAGASDWGVYQVPRALDRMQQACTRMSGIHLVPGAGHWVQQEQPAAVAELVLQWLEAA